MRLSIAGFSLVELMVAVGIVGVLVTLALPRYHQFMVQARRGEAKSNLSHLASLQQMYKIEHYDYYRGPAMRGTQGIGYKDGKGNDGLCNDPLIDVDQGLGNYLGFRPGGTTAGCRQLRYFYQFNAGGDAVASAASDADPKHIYPDCNGYGCSECGYEFGDALTLPMGGKIKVCRNITKYCPDGGCGTPPPCPATTTCATGETLHTSPPCCRPICPASCPTGEALHPAPECCQPCSCVYQTGGDRQTTSWTTTNSTPSGAVTPANAYTCETLNQEAEFTETWTASSPECAISYPCPDRPYTKHQGVLGVIPPDCDTSADRGISACPCVSGDTRTTAPNNCCSITTPCPPGTVSGTSYTGMDANDVALDFNGNFDCQVIGMQKVIKAINYTPARPDCPNTLTGYETACGTKAVTCNDVIRHSRTMTYGECIPTLADSSVCEETRTYSWQLKLPCADSPDCSSSLSLDTCTTLGGITGATCSTTAGTTICSKLWSNNRSCTCPEKLCANSGTYNGLTETAAETKCEEDYGPNEIFTATLNGTTLECECERDNTPPPCFDHNNVVIPQSVIDTCNAAPHTSWDATNCVCVGERGRTYSIELCTSPGTGHWTGLDRILTDVGRNIGSSQWVGTLSGSIVNNQAAWGDALKEIRCGGGGATAHADHASVQTFNHLVNYNTSQIGASANTAYGVPRTGNNRCTDFTTVSWTCD